VRHSRVATILTIVLSLLLAGGPARATFPGTNGKIAFVSWRDGPSSIYTMNADGSGVTRLTANFSASDAYPKWSPDGTKIAFQRYESGQTDVYTMTSNGSSQLDLTEDPATDELPAWSPDGTQIVFDSDRDGTGRDIFVMNADGTGVTQLTFETTAIDFEAAWSPDGSQIAFAKDLNGSYQLFVMNTDGSGQERITHSALNDQFPNWSPDGRHLVFERCTDRLQCGIRASWASGKHGRQLTVGPEDHNPTWSPDGLLIAFATNIGAGNFEIYSMNFDGTGLVNLTNNTAVDLQPDWQSLP
jgi:TolB protein